MPLHDELRKGARKKRVTRKKAAEVAEGEAAAAAADGDETPVVKVRRRTKVQD